MSKEKVKGKDVNVAGINEITVGGAILNGIKNDEVTIKREDGKPLSEKKSNEIATDKKELKEVNPAEGKAGGEFISKWYGAILGNNMTTLRDSVEQGIKIMIDGIADDQYENLYFLFHSASDKLEALGNLLDIDSNIEHCKVFTYAIFWALDKISDKLYSRYLSESSIQNKYEEVKLLRKSRYFYQLMELLEKNGELPQGALAERLSISTNALSNFLRRNEQYGLWDHKRYGKYNYYYLTGQGKDYLALYRRQELMNNNDSISSILRSFMDYLADEIEAIRPNVENISHKINKQFGNGQVLFGSESDKLAMHKTIRRINCHVRRRERQNSLKFGMFEDSDSFFYAVEFPYIYDLEKDDYHIEDVDYSVVGRGGMV